jgi:hypothetical protein
MTGLERTAVERCSRWALVPYLLIADAENSLLAAFLIFSGRVLYPFYASAPCIDGITAMTDQIVAGAIMWLPGLIGFLVSAVAIVIGALEPHTLARPEVGRYTHDPALLTNRHCWC